MAGIKLNNRASANLQAGEALSQFDIVYGNSVTGKVMKAQNDNTEAETNAIGIVIEDDGIVNDEYGKILFYGLVTNIAWNLTPLADVFLSSTYGGITQDQSSITGYVKPIGFAISTTQVYFNFATPGWAANLVTDETGKIIYDTQANRPAAGTQGREFICTDGVLPVRQIDTGSAWMSVYDGLQCSLPPSASTLTSVNSDASNTFSDINGGLYIKQVGRASSEFMTAHVTALPSAPYSFTIGYRIKTLKQAAYCYVGMCLTDGNGATPKLALLATVYRGTGADNLYIGNGYYPSPTTWSADNTITATSTYQLGWPVVFLNITDDNTNRIYKVSCDGIVWTTHELKGRTDYFTPTHGGLVIGQNGAGLTAGVTTAEAYIFHWSLG